jgi:hypothetical protein
MEVTLTRKLLSYFVSLMLLFFCKSSYDVHHHPAQSKNQEPSLQNQQGLPSKIFSPPEQKQEPLQSGESPVDLYFVQDGKTKPSPEDTESENDEVKSSPKTNTPKKAK